MQAQLCQTELLSQKDSARMNAGKLQLVESMTSSWKGWRRRAQGRDENSRRPPWAKVIWLAFSPVTGQGGRAGVGPPCPMLCRQQHPVCTAVGVPWLGTSTWAFSGASGQL